MALHAKGKFPSLALRRLWARERNMLDVQFVSAVSEGSTKVMPLSSATGVAFVTRSHCGLMEISVCPRNISSEYVELTVWANELTIQLSTWRQLLYVFPKISQTCKLSMEGVEYEFSYVRHILHQTIE